MRRDLTAVADVLVSYSAESMPTSVIEALHQETVDAALELGVPTREHFQILDLLLKVTIQKLGVVEEMLIARRAA